jgi:hypothetical protein
MNVTVILLRQHRTIALWLGAILVVVVSAGLVVIAQAGPLQFSFWLAIAGSMAKYGLLVAGIMLVSMHFRLFVSQGVTRHEFLIAAALAGLVFAAVFAVVVTGGHAAESAVLGLADQRAAGYPAVRLSEAGRVFPVALGYFISGMLIAAGFYRFRPLPGLALLVPGLLPMFVAEVLLSFNELGDRSELMAYAPALAITMAVIALGAAAAWTLMRDVPIRRAAG